MSIVLNTIYTFNSFAIVWVLTQGEPANSTDIAVTYLYKLAFRYGKLADASVVSLMMLALLILFTAVYVSLSRRSPA
jgi:multiple sugar transport system permease protein